MNPETMQLQYGDDAPVERLAEITQSEWDLVKQQIAEIHTVLKDIGQSVGPMVQRMQSGGIMGLLSGMKGR